MIGNHSCCARLASEVFGINIFQFPHISHSGDGSFIFMLLTLSEIVCKKNLIAFADSEGSRALINKIFFIVFCSRIKFRFSLENATFHFFFIALFCSDF